MGISCEIHLCTAADGKYIFQPGSIVSGAIKYYLHEEYEFTSIIVSLKGQGKLYFEDKFEKCSDRMHSYSNNEKYVDIDNIILKNEPGKPLPVGQYETPFGFQLPYDIPASLDYTKDTLSYYARCTIQYYVRIKFERPGRFNINKHYKKEINVISGQTPRMTTKPLVYGDQKCLLQLSSLFSSKKGFINLKATIVNSVLRPGKRIKINYEIENNTDVDVKRVKVNLTEVDKYNSIGGREVKVQSEVEGTEFTYGAIRGEETAKFKVEIIVPSLCASLDHSKIISRDYSVLTSVVLPKPHINMSLEIPFQVIARLSSTRSFEECSASTSTAGYSSDAPPTYWEAMGQEKNESHDKEADYDLKSVEKGN